MYQDTSSNFLLTLGDYKNVSLQTTKSQPKCFDGIAYLGYGADTRGGIGVSVPA